MNLLSFRLHSRAMSIFALCADARRSHFYIRRDTLNNNHKMEKSFIYFLWASGMYPLSTPTVCRHTEQVGRGRGREDANMEMLEFFHWNLHRSTFFSTHFALVVVVTRCHPLQQVVQSDFFHSILIYVYAFADRVVFVSHPIIHSIVTHQTNFLPLSVKLLRQMPYGDMRSHF